MGQSIRSEMRGPLLISMNACELYIQATPGQPLILRRQPQNPVDYNALICCDMAGQPMGYVAREDAARVSPEIDQGYMWRGKVTDPCKHDGRRIKVHTRIYLWREDPSSKEQLFSTARTPEKV